MNLYIFLVVLIGILMIALPSKESQYYYKTEKTFCFIIYAILIFVAAFRNYSVGPDTPGYMLTYYASADWSWSYAFERCMETNNYTFIILEKLIADTGFSVQFFFGLIEFIYVYALAKLINKYSTNKLLSILLFITTGVFSFSLAGVRQTMAMGLCLLSFCKMDEKKYIMAVFYYLLAFFTHSVTAIFILCVIIYYGYKFRSFKTLFVIACILFVFFAPSALFIATNALGSEHYSDYLDESYAYSSSVLIFFCIIVAYSIVLALMNKSNSQLSNAILISISLLVPLSQFLANYNPHLHRLPYFFLPFFYILGANSTENSKSPLLFKTILFVMVSFWAIYVTRNSSYEFIPWSEIQ